jgi:hypothetical protein
MHNRSVGAIDGNDFFNLAPRRRLLRQQRM